jgi:hypothetical protein
LVFAHLVQEAAVMQRVKQPEAHPFVETGAGDYIPQAKNVARGLERLEDMGLMDQRLDHIPAVVGSLHLYRIVKQKTAPMAELASGGLAPNSRFRYVLQNVMIPS